MIYTQKLKFKGQSQVKQISKRNGDSDVGDIVMLVT